MLEIAVCLLLVTLLALIALFFYRKYRKANTTTIQLTDVSLRVDRKALLTQKRQAVASRRDTLDSKTKPPVGQSPPETAATTKPQTTHPESSEDGFGEDLGMALTLAQTPPRRESRFSKLKGAAKELEDAYNQNNTIKP